LHAFAYRLPGLPQEFFLVLTQTPLGRADQVIPFLVRNCTILGYGSVYLFDEPRV
jgi:hypothetical protein